MALVTSTWMLSRPVRGKKTRAWRVVKAMMVPSERFVSLCWMISQPASQ